MGARVTLLAIALATGALAPLPAAARDDAPDGPHADAIARKLNDPMTQYAVAGMVYAMAHAILDAPVPAVVGDIERLGNRTGTCDMPPGATVGQMVGTSSDRAREAIIDHVPRAMQAMGAMAGALEQAAPELKRMARRVREAAQAH